MKFFQKLTFSFLLVLGLSCSGISPCTLSAKKHTYKKTAAKSSSRRVTKEFGPGVFLGESEYNLNENIAKSLLSLGFKVTNEKTEIIEVTEAVGVDMPAKSYEMKVKNKTFEKDGIRVIFTDTPHETPGDIILEFIDSDVKDHFLWECISGYHFVPVGEDTYENHGSISIHSDDFAITIETTCVLQY